MTLEELEKRQDELAAMWDELQAEINALKKAQAEEAKPEPPHPRWKPEYKEKYYIVFYNGSSVETYWTGCQSDMGEYDIGIVFKTKEEAEFAIERMKVIAEMKEWAGKNNDGAYIYYHRPFDQIMIDWDGDSNYCHGDIRFKSVDDARNCIKAVGKERIKKYYFMIPEGKTNE